MFRKLLIVSLVVSFASAAFFNREYKEYVGEYKCDVMSKSMAGYEIRFAVSEKEPYEVLWMTIKNPSGCVSKLALVGVEYEK